MSDPEDNLREETLDTFKNYLSTNGLRLTNQRVAIFDAAYNMADHFTAEGLLERSREIDRDVSRATVYRSIPILVECQVIREIDVAKDQKFYAANHDTKSFKAQVICSECEKIFEIDAPFMEWYGNSVAAKLDMEILSRRLQVVAKCRKGPNCPERKRRQSPVDHSTRVTDVFI